jgi:transposase
MISSIRLDGSKACMTIDAPTDGDVFQAFTEQVLVPALRPGDVVVMDNLGAHRREEIAAAITRAGARAEYLPAYSPDLNPIEKMWSKVKECLRAAKARTSDALDAAIEAAFQSVTSQDAVAWFASCGYTIK